MQKHIFLVEIGTEELPSKILKRLGCDFSYQISNELKNNNIHCVELDWFASARHLAVKSKIQITDKNIVVHVNKLNKHHSNNGLYISTVNNNQNKILDFNLQKKYKCEDNIEKNSNSIHSVLCNIVNIALSKLTNYEMMRWGEIEHSFVRPIRTVTILLDMYLIRGCVFSIDTDRVLYGHQSMENNKIIIEHADDYPSILYNKGKVIVDYNKRKEIIYLGVKEEANKIGGVVNIEDNGLLDEVTSLVEWPIILSGKFDKKFLSLPDEVVHHIMQYDQRYFPVYNSAANDMLLPYFIFVANTIAENYDSIIVGYENVIKPRLMDAEFFFKKDDQYTLEDYLSKLDSVLFHSKLGTLRDKSYRISMLSGWISSKIGEDVLQAKRAGYLCKCDLMSSMVFEFPSTQGIIGMHYAYRDGESEKVALAQKEHYYPKSTTDVLPTNRLSCTVAIADKMDTISGMFGIKVFPKGNRDPFALKRSAIGILRILIQKKISLNLFDLIAESVKLYELKLINPTVIRDIHTFMYQRLYAWYCTQMFKKDIIKAVLAVDYFNVLNVDIRIRAVTDFCSLKKEDNIYKLYFIYKRVSSLIVKRQVFVCENLKNELLELPEEIQLVNQIIIAEEKINLFLQNNDYYKALILLVTVCDSINKFLDNVIVMDKNQKVQENRLILLNKIKNLFLQIVDVSFLKI